MNSKNCIIAKILLLYLVAATFCVYAEARHSKKHSAQKAAGPAAADNCTTEASGRGLCSDFRALRDLIPQNQLVAMTARHYKYDYQFRHAMRFIRTDEFKALAAQIDESVAYQGMLQRFQEAEVNTTDIDGVEKIIDCLLVPVPLDIDADGTNSDNTNSSGKNRRRGRTLIQARSVQSYAREILKALPHDKVQSTLVDTMKQSSEFNKFYEVVRNSTFHQQIIRDFATAELRKVLRTLRRNFIDVRCLIEDIFKVFSWGPAL